MADTALDMLLVNMTHLMNSNFRLFFDEKEINEIRYLNEQLEKLRLFLEDAETKQYGHEKGKNLVAQIIDLAHRAEDVISLWAVNSVKSKRRNMAERIGNAFYPGHRILRGINKEIRSIMVVIRTIDDEKYGIGVSRVGTPSKVILSGTNTPNAEEDIVVGFDHETEAIKERLTGSPQHLEIISIVGMAGLGKTTLARKLYNDPLIVYHFYVRGWTYVSQAYQKKDLLLEILSSIVDHKDEVAAISEDKLEEQLYRRLKGKRYLIVMDDIWDIDAWDKLKKCFPNDYNGSRVLFTSRLKDVALHSKPNSPPHFLRFLTADESLDLLKLKVFRKENCPEELMQIGREITRRCQGLPLAIVVIAGLLAQTDKTENWWTIVAESISSHIASDPKDCMDTLALSYNHLPRHLKPCFIYFGAFLEDSEISVRKLIWLWIAEGFIKSTGVRRLEDIAEEYLVDLINRNLVLAAKKRSTGGIRSCRVHDLLRDLCLRKAKEEKFLHQRHEEVSSASSPPESMPINWDVEPSLVKQPFKCFPSSFTKLPNNLCLKDTNEENFPHKIYGYEERRLCIYLSSSSSSFSFAASSSSPSSSSGHILDMPRYLCSRSRVLNYISSKPSSTPHVRSLLYFATERSQVFQKTMSFNSQVFQCLRVLDLSAISIHAFPITIINLVLLRYLALKGKNLRIPYSISKLWNLETLLIAEGMGTEIPQNILNLPQLRHLCVAGENRVGGHSYTSLPCDLQTLSQVTPFGCSNVLERTPNLRKLGFCGSFIVEGKFWFPDLGSLNHLESLKLLNRTRTLEGDGSLRYGQRYNLEGVRFPPNLKRLTLSLTYLDWNSMSTLGMLPNLEALKLEYQACVGQRWETSDGGFRQLKYLKLYYMNIEEWNADSTHFPNLQHLVLHKCEKLKAIPSEFCYIDTLHTIDISWCSPSTVYYARKIQEEQQSNGNDWLQIFIYPPDWEPQHI